MRDAFVATVSHELRTPLTSISGFLEMMQDEEEGLGESGPAVPRGDPPQHRPAATARRGPAARSRRSRRTGSSWCSARSTSTRSRGAHRGGPPDRHGEGGRPAAGGRRPPPVRATRAGSRRCSTISISNAVKFTKAGGTVTVSVGRNGPFARVEVTDTGVGIPLDEQGQLFSSFFRALDSDASGDSRNRARPRDLACDRRAARRHGRAREPRGQGHEGHGHAAGPSRRAA